MSAEDWRDELQEVLEPMVNRAIKIIEAAVEAHVESAAEAEERAAEAEEQLRSQESDHDLLRELAEDRHGLAGDGQEHRGTLRTCPNRLCEEAADLLGRQQ